MNATELESEKVLAIRRLIIVRDANEALVKRIRELTQARSVEDIQEIEHAVP